MDANYKLINSVDPAKCRPKIRDKFSKLTLSSNKKKQKAPEVEKQIRESIANSNVSRNLLSELMTDDESGEEMQQQKPKEPVENLLMRTDSSPSSRGRQNKNKVSLDTTHCSEAERDIAEKSVEMEPLVVSALENSDAPPNIEQDIEKLSSRVSMLTVGGAPVTISSEGSCHELSRIVSTENQRMGHGQRFSDLLKAQCKKEPNVSICISSSSCEDSDAPITITDSSDGEEEYAVHVSPPRATNLPPSLDTAKADRMAIFLRDVRRNYGLPVDTPEREYDDRQREIATADTEPMTSESLSQTLETPRRGCSSANTKNSERRAGEPMQSNLHSLGTVKRMASADTESMSLQHETTLGQSVPSQPQSPNGGKQRAAPDSESMTPENDHMVTPKNISKARLAAADTVDMTMTSETSPSSPHYAPVMNVRPDLLSNSATHSSASMPEDSLTIAETSEEEDEPALEQPRPSSELTKSNSMSLKSVESSLSSRQDSQFQINISAKINIKIQVSQQMEESMSPNSTAPSATSDRSRSESPNDQPQSSAENANQASPTSNRYGSESADEKPQSSAHKAKNQTSAFEEIPHSPPERDNPTPRFPEVEKKSPEAMEMDMDRAQRLLNELYGNNWKTPEVMRSLKKTTASSKRSARAPAPAPVPTEPRAEAKDESALDDFSIFRRNIPQDLDSTRLPCTPVSSFKTSAPNFKTPKPVGTASRTTRRPQVINEEESTTKTPQLEVTKTKSGREVRQRWRTIVDSDSDSDGENASGDSDKSWDETDEANEAENVPPPKEKRGKPKTNLSRKKNDSDLIYLDLSKGEVEVQHNVSLSPPANHDEKFNRRLEEILRTCKFEDKPKLECTPGKSKRKLFTAFINENDENLVAPFDPPKERLQNIDKDDESVSLSGAPMPARFEPLNKHLESVKTGKPIFKIQTPTTAKRDCGHTPGKALSQPVPRTPKSKEQRVIADVCATPKDKYGFLKSLDACVAKSLCHPDALHYRENYRQKRDELASKLYEIYKAKCFNQELDVPIKWNKKLTHTAGRCMNKKRLGERTCVIELSEKVLTSADRLRCTLIHELCHAATWIFNGEGGHGAAWKAWARKANQVFPELPKIGVCHQYDIEYKYTYKCTLCAAKSHAHSKSKKVENIRCSYCHGAIEVYLNKKDKEGNTIATPVREPTGFAKFVKEKYKEYKRPDLKHADIMKLLSNEFASMKVDGKT